MVKRTFTAALALVALALLSGCREASPAALAVSPPQTGQAPAATATPAAPPTVAATLAADAASAGSAAPTRSPSPALIRNADGYARLTARELAQLMQEGEVTLLHVHFLHEWEIPGTDLYLPVGQLASRLGELPPRDALIVLYCRSGNVSQAAARYLAQQGYTNVADLQGGYAAWHAAGLPLLDRR
jgi:rhodanese-related sulfurtransferase